MLVWLLSLAVETLKVRLYEPNLLNDMQCQTTAEQQCEVITDSRGASIHTCISHVFHTADEHTTDVCEIEISEERVTANWKWREEVWKKKRQQETGPAALFGLSTLLKGWWTLRRVKSNKNRRRLKEAAIPLVRKVWQVLLQMAVVRSWWILQSKSENLCDFFLYFLTKNVASRCCCG